MPCRGIVVKSTHCPVFESAWQPHDQNHYRHLANDIKYTTHNRHGIYALIVVGHIKPDLKQWKVPGLTRFVNGLLKTPLKPLLFIFFQPVEHRVCIRNFEWVGRTIVTVTIFDKHFLDLTIVNHHCITP